MRNFIKRQSVYRVAVIAFLLIAVAIAIDHFDTADALSNPYASGVNANRSTYIHAGPSVKSHRKHTLKTSEKVKIEFIKFNSNVKSSAKYRWYYLSAYNGYVRSDFIRISSYDYIYGKTKSEVNIRSGAGDRFAKKGRCRQGTLIKIANKCYDGNGRLWYRIRVDNSFRYVRASYVSLDNKRNPSATSCGLHREDLLKTMGMYFICGKTKAGYVNVRKGAGENFSVKTCIKNNGITDRYPIEYFKSYTRNKPSLIWYYAVKNHGYIRSDLVTQTSLKGIGVKANTSANIRIGAGTGFKSTGLTKAGKTYIMVARAYSKDGDRWSKIRFGSRYYYIKTKYLTLTPTVYSRSPSKIVNAVIHEETNASSGSPKTNLHAFPSSYRPYIQKLQNARPNWVFIPQNTGLTWYAAWRKMTANTGSNTMWYTYPWSYMSVKPGCYNYLAHRYYGKDGNRFVAASETAVKYYMDPRNWLTTSYAFMFEDQRFHGSYQTVSAVKSVLKRNKYLKENAKAFVNAGRKYNINAIYLASKAIEEQGSGSGGRGGYYNVFNIGANDSRSGGFSNGIRYARRRGWTSRAKSIYGGAKFLAGNYVNSGQSTAYLEHFNVMNGYNAVGTHVYMTAVYAPRNTAFSKGTSYNRYGLHKKKLLFYIPVFKNMPAKASTVPSNGYNKDNNYYLKTLKFTGGGRTYTMLSGRRLDYRTTFTKYVSASTSNIKILAKKASVTNAIIYGTGTKKLSFGKNVFKIRCRSSSGLSRTYSLTVYRG